MIFAILNVLFKSYFSVFTIGVVFIDLVLFIDILHGTDN